MFSVIGIIFLVLATLSSMILYQLDTLESLSALDTEECSQWSSSLMSPVTSLLTTSVSIGYLQISLISLVTLNQEMTHVKAGMLLSCVGAVAGLSYPVLSCLETISSSSSLSVLGSLLITVSLTSLGPLASVISSGLMLSEYGEDMQTLLALIILGVGLTASLTSSLSSLPCPLFVSLLSSGSLIGVLMTGLLHSSLQSSAEVACIPIASHLVSVLIMIGWKFIHWILISKRQKMYQRLDSSF